MYSMTGAVAVIPDAGVAWTAGAGAVQTVLEEEDDRNPRNLVVSMFTMTKPYFARRQTTLSAD